MLVLFGASILLGGLASASPQSDREARYYPLATLPIPPGIVLEAGAIQVLPGSKLAVSTRLGDIYIVDGAFANSPTNVTFKRFASGLHEVLGLWTSGDGTIYATQRGEVTRLKDTDADGRADLFETVADGWGINGDYHEYAFGSKPDRDGNIWVVLCLTGSFNSESKFRGWALRVTPDGRVIPTTSGLRSPGGVATNYLGDMFYTDNQGPWNGTCWLKPLVPGGFVGHPGGFGWYAQATNLGGAPKEPLSGSRIAVERAKIPEFVPPAIAFPYNKMGQSASGIANDYTAGKFGPFTNQLFVGDQTWSTVMRVFLERVNGVYQGACFPFREGLASGSLSLEMAPDGSLFVGGTDRGWGARGGKPFALERLRWSGQTPFEIHEMRARPDGFELTFTEPVDVASAGSPSSYQFEDYTYIYQASYGSPEVDGAKPPIESAKVSSDAKSVQLKVKLTPGHLHELKLPGVRSASGEPLLHPVGYYWLNEIPAKLP
ncbi:MAG TPA: hypothetical protein DCE44_06660 [Verrucomicrobiales bacterium]|nr:hypothetical protein [Verrucomicrobiales bacterium]